MSFIKYAELDAITVNDIKSTGSAFSDFNVDISALEQFKKTASELKKIAPKANDFLYFTAIFMHAAEAALIDDNGNIKKDASGNDVTSNWDVNEKTGTWKWNCSDPSIRPLKNSNGDIFPEAELKKCYKGWVSKPLCVDHQSNKADAIRGIIVDTYYDDKYKRIVGLCALDKVNYGELARKIATGYAASVSMGTAVSIACCSDCGKAAKIESEFCEHMRNKSCYGEINVGLNPIELSIVVNGADPKAKIRHIVAAANTIAKYVDQKETLVSESKDMMSAIEVEQLEADLAKAQETLGKLKKFVSKSVEELEKKDDDEDKENEDEKDEKEEKDDNDASDAAYGQPGSGIPTIAEAEIETVDKPWSSARFADSNIDINKVIADVISKDENIEKILTEKIENYTNKIALLQSAIKTNNKDLDMTREKQAYFQGGGDVNEPAPKQVKYPKEDADSIREKDDKQMQPQTNNGKIDGLVDGDEALKKTLLRADDATLSRQLRREAALEVAKKAYHQGGGDVNEPTPGKPKYPKEDSDSIRAKEDKQMVGESPFPGVGKTDALYGDDLKKKQMLARAKLNASFIKAANSDGSDNAAESRWQVFADKKLILTATVGEIAGKDKAEFMFDSIATKEFGKKLISTIKTEGFDKAVSLFKGAQEAPAVAGPGADLTAPENVMPAELPTDVVTDAGDAGDPLDQVENQVNKMDNLVADMKQAVDALKNEDTSDLDALTPVAASDSSVSMAAMRKTLNASLQKGIKQAMEDLNDQIVEHNLIKDVYERNSVPADQEAFVSEMVASAVDEADKLISNANSLKSAFVKYARGTDALIKKANEAKLTKSAEAADVLLADDHMPKVDTVEKMQKDLKKLVDTQKKDDKNNADTNHPGEANDPNDWKNVIKDLGKDMNPNGKPAPGQTPPPDMKPKVDPPADMFADDTNNAVEFTMKPDGSVEGKADKLSEVHASNEPDLQTKEGRAEMRAKLAQKGLKFSDILDKAHPGGGTTTKLDTKPEGDLAKVEDLEEVHNKVMDVATSAPRKVREAAAHIQKLVVAGRIDPEKDFDGLMAEGLDSDAVKYWKKFYGEAKDGGSQFAAELVKDHENKKKAEEMETYRVKVARAYDLAHDMASRGMIANNREAVAEQVKSMVDWSDNYFESMKRVAERTPLVKSASALPAVGFETDYTGTEQIVVPAKTADLKGEYDKLFAGRKLTGRSF